MSNKALIASLAAVSILAFSIAGFSAYKAAEIFAHCGEVCSLGVD